ncbi:thioredoxin-like protein AAED1, chloroplastic [Zingiber officinale]|uniref:thioredoxin-like protein AAED1, chloroplastic n=1 Tax=Zingiber officinale TaxID=94328 RepID=UPI001C4C58A0|nr:thioredoxin-like protein AAED1, chloroplastic [Zingiber officinale]XP_042417390.1 thioredoxin-like protein AAED1, chloroplastic [Zingiber officinale]
MAIAYFPSLTLSPPRSSVSGSKSPPKPSVGLIPRFARLVTSRLQMPILRAASPGSSAAVTTGGVDATATWDALDGVRVFAVGTGEPVFLRDLWDQNEGVAVVALMRHFGCFCCWELASVLKESISKFDAAGVKLIAVGVGTPDKARMLAERLPFPMDYLYADSERKAYGALGLYFGLGRTFFNPASTKVFSRWESIKKANKNYTITATPDDRSSVLQQGGMFVFKGKQLLYGRKDEGTGDHAPLDEILNICNNAKIA